MNRISILIGATIAILATFIYSTLTNAFLSGSRFRSKEQSIFIYLVTATILGCLTPLINSFWTYLMLLLGPVRIAGLLIIVGNASVNQMVKKWRHTTKKSLLIYFIGILLLIFGSYLHI